MSKVIITTELELETIIQASIRKVLGEQVSQNRASDEYLNVKEASAFLNLAPQTIYQFTSSRSIPFLKKGKKLYFSRDSLSKWLSEGQKKTGKELAAELSGKGELK